MQIDSEKKERYMVFIPLAQQSQSISTITVTASTFCRANAALYSLII